MNIQLTANAEFDDGFIDIVPVSEAEFFSLYVGEPGSYDWIADFSTLIVAREIGQLLADRHGYNFVEHLI